MIVVNIALSYRTTLVQDLLKESKEIKIICLPKDSLYLDIVKVYWHRVKQALLVSKHCKTKQDAVRHIWISKNDTAFSRHQKIICEKIQMYTNKFRICSRCLRKFSDLGTNLACFENISYFSRHDVNTYQISIHHQNKTIFYIELSFFN